MISYLHHHYLLHTYFPSKVAKDYNGVCSYNFYSKAGKDTLLIQLNLGLSCKRAMISVLRLSRLSNAKMRPTIVSVAVRMPNDKTHPKVLRNLKNYMNHASEPLRIGKLASFVLAPILDPIAQSVLNPVVEVIVHDKQRR